MASQLQNLTIEISDLLLNGLARLEQRPDRSDQIRAIFNQLSGSRGEDIERGATSRPIRTAPGALDLTNEAIASASESTTPSRTTDPVWLTTQIEVRFNDTSSPT